MRIANRDYRTKHSASREQHKKIIDKNNIQLHQMSYTKEQLLRD